MCSGVEEVVDLTCEASEAAVVDLTNNDSVLVTSVIDHWSVIPVDVDLVVDDVNTDSSFSVVYSCWMKVNTQLTTCCCFKVKWTEQCNMCGVLHQVLRAGESPQLRVTSSAVMKTRTRLLSLTPLWCPLFTLPGIRWTQHHITSVSKPCNRLSLSESSLCFRSTPGTISCPVCLDSYTEVRHQVQSCDWPRAKPRPLHSLRQINIMWHTTTQRVSSASCWLADSRLRKSSSGCSVFLKLFGFKISFSTLTLAGGNSRVCRA